MLELVKGGARVQIDPQHGGRIVAFAVDGFDLLLTPADDPGGTHWGCFVMAPWAGRTRDARFSFLGTEHQLPVNSGHHSIHGTVRTRPWAVTAAGSDRVHLTCEFGPEWPFAGWAEQLIEVHEDRVELELALHAADGPMPAVGGWHPWWRRRGPGGEPATLELPAGSMLRRDADWIATAEKVSPPPRGPWDDCFTDLSGPPGLRWAGTLSLVIDSDCPFVVVYDQPEEAICVEPQSGPPDALNRDPDVAEPGLPVVIHSTWRWSAA